jgi:UPF0176 protein
MTVLHNRINKKELKARMMADPTPRTTISFYRYVPIEQVQEFRDQRYREWIKLGVLGRVYVAQEGINAQISVPTAQVERFREALYQLPGLAGTRLNFAVDDNGKSFYKLDLKVRHKIVADGIDDPGFNPADTGTHLKAEDWNRLSEDENVVIVDMRNQYESEVGHFEGAILPDCDTFREELDKVIQLIGEEKDKKVMMYCTGGIRCEKASAWMKYNGFPNVYQLEGGIIQYARRIKELGLPSKFHGKNFVFDERLGERITPEIIAHCHQCGQAADTHVNCANDACHLLFIQCEACGQSMEGCCSNECREVIHLPEAEQRALRKRIRKNSGTAHYRGLRLLNNP